MRPVVAAAVLSFAIAACSGLPRAYAPSPSTIPEARQMVSDLCAAEGIGACAADPSYPYWMFANAIGGSIQYRADRCAEDLSFCRFVIWHEIGHVRNDNGDERAADCYAASHADSEAVRAALHFFSHNWLAGDEQHPTSVERFTLISRCSAR